MSQFDTVHMPKRPGDPDYVSVEEHTRRELARRAEYEVRPDIIAKRVADAESDARMAIERNAKRQRPKLVQTTDYPWLREEGWIDRQPARPFKRK